MNGTTIALPGVSFEALKGVPSAAILTDSNARRRYGEPSWRIDTWAWGECPAFLEARAADEGWPVTYKARQGVKLVLMMRPLPVPDDLDAQVDGALEHRADAWVHDARAVLGDLAAGSNPTISTASIDEPLGAAILESAQRGHAARLATFHAVAETPRQTA